MPCRFDVMLPRIEGIATKSAAVKPQPANNEISSLASPKAKTAVEKRTVMASDRTNQRIATRS